MSNEPELLTSEEIEQLKDAINRAAGTPEGAAPLLGLPNINLAIPGLGQAKETLTKLVAATDTLLQYKWLIPDQYEAAIVSLNGALKKVLGWLPA